ncbi:recombinase family protein, partial [Streptomyces sp. NPDC059900]
MQGVARSAGVDVVQEEEPLQLGAGRLLGELPVRLGLLISQKLHRHERTVASPSTRPAIFPRTSAEPPAGALTDHDQSQRQPLYRCSPRPDQQSTARQDLVLHEAGIEDPVVFEEDPGTSSRLHPLQRPKFGELLTYARPGDTVHISEMFRLVRGNQHIL